MTEVALALRAMATRFELLLLGDDPVRLRAAGQEALAEIERVEARLSRYRPTSDVAAVNAGAGGPPVRVDPRTAALLLECAELNRRTEGAFDVTVGPLLRAWGFVGGRGAPADPRALEQARERVGMRWVEVDGGASTVRLSREGMELDLGAVGKGDAIERAIAVLREHEVRAALLHGGTSSVHAIGRPRDGEDWGVGWRVPGAPLRVRRLDALRPALAVSAPHGKAFLSDGRLCGHVLDPRTGEPARAARSACVAGPASTLCDALSTALLVLGEPWAEVLAARFPGYEGGTAPAGDGLSRDLADATMDCPA